MGPEALPHLQIHYWSSIEKALTKLGAKVVVAGVPRYVCVGLSFVGWSWTAANKHVLERTLFEECVTLKIL